MFATAPCRWTLHHLLPRPETASGRSGLRVRGGHGGSRPAEAAAALTADDIHVDGGEPRPGQTGAAPGPCPALPPLGPGGALRAVVGPGESLGAATCFAETFRVRGSECDPSGLASTSSLVDLLIETAGNHAVALWGRTTDGRGFARAEEMGSLILVMSKLSLRVIRRPKWGSRVVVMTYFQVRGKAGATREWFLSDDVTGELLASAASAWVMVDLETRRLARIPPAMLERFTPYTPEWRPLDDDAAASAALRPVDRGPVPATDAAVVEGAGGGTAPAGVTTTTRHSLRHRDIDMNAHVTTATYVAWIESAVAALWSAVGGRGGTDTDLAQLGQLDIEFRGEIRGGEGPVEATAAVVGAERQIVVALRALGETDPKKDLVRARVSGLVA